jgi:hypothetical protein
MEVVYGFNMQSLLLNVCDNLKGYTVYKIWLEDKSLSMRGFEFLSV